MTSIDTRELDLTGVRPPEKWVRRYVEMGAWRTDTIVDDLERWASTTPDATAIVARRGEHTARITYREYGASVNRFAAALHELGVGPGQVVALWLPNRWEVPALMLACWKLGAVVAPVMPTIGPRELERMLARLEASVCITVDELDGVAHAELLSQVARRLPCLAHEVVLGAPRTGQLHFDEHFQARPAGAQPPATAPVDPDRVGLVLFTSGTTGEPKAALHTLNTVAFTASSWASTLPIGTDDRLFSPHALTHIVGMLLGVFMPLTAGAEALILERWDPAAATELMAAGEASVLMAAPVFVEELLEALADTGVELPSLRHVYSGATMIPRALVSEVPRRLGVPLRASWGMTEATVIYHGPDDPADAAAYGVGRPAEGLEVTVVADGDAPVTDEAPGRMLVRGAGVCLATVGRDTGALDVIAERDDGWYDTGDLAVGDGRGGYRLMGRAADRIGGAFMIPVADVEDALRAHPAVADVALIGMPDGHGGEVGCAVVRPTDSRAPTLAELRDFLHAEGMTEWYLPRRVEIVDELPHNPTGKVEKKVLRDRFAAASNGAGTPDAGPR